MQKLIGSATAGLAATLFMEYASTWLYERQSEPSRQREDVYGAALGLLLAAGSDD